MEFILLESRMHGKQPTSKRKKSKEKKKCYLGIQNISFPVTELKVSRGKQVHRFYSENLHKLRFDSHETSCIQYIHIQFTQNIILLHT